MLRPAKKAPAQKAHSENPMNTLHYIGFDVHKKTISFCVKTAAGEIVEEGVVAAQRAGLRQWAAARPQTWRGAMEATLFSGWIYDTLQPYSEQLEMAHPAKMKAISAGKKKSDTLDARTIADLVRCNLLPACYVAPPRAGNVREHAEAAGARVARRFRTCRTRRTVDDDSSRRRNYRADLGPGGRRPATLPLQLRCHALLRTDRRFEVFGGQAATRTDLQTAQPLAANHADRGRQAGPAMESSAGGAACPRTGTRTSQPGHTGRGAQTRRLSAGGRQKPSALPSARPRKCRHKKL